MYEFLVKVTRKSGHENFFVVSALGFIEAIVEVLEVFKENNPTVEITEIRVAQLGTGSESQNVKFPLSPF